MLELEDIYCENICELLKIKFEKTFLHEKSSPDVEQPTWGGGPAIITYYF